MAVLWAVLLAGCAASGPRVKPEALAPAPAVWLLDVQDAPVALLEVLHLAPGDRVEVKSQGPELQVSLRFAHGVRVTPLVRSVSGTTPVLLRSEDSHSGQGARPRLTRAVREARYEEARRALAEVAEREQDDVSREVVAALPEEALRRMALHREGNLLLESLFDAMTSQWRSGANPISPRTARCSHSRGLAILPSPLSFLAATGRAWSSGMDGTPCVSTRMDLPSSTPNSR